MFDSNLLFSDGKTQTADGFSSSVAVNKTPAEGVWIEVVVTAASGSLDISVYENTDGTPTTGARVGAFPTITAAGRYCALVQSDLANLALYYDVGLTSPTFTIAKAGIVSGPTQDAVV